MTGYDYARTQPLGYHRQRILSCFFADRPKLPTYFEPPPMQDIFLAYRTYADRMADLFANETDRISRALVGALRLLAGQIDAAEAILNALGIVLKQKPYFTDEKNPSY